MFDQDRFQSQKRSRYEPCTVEVGHVPLSALVHSGFLLALAWVRVISTDTINEIILVSALNRVQRVAYFANRASFSLACCVAVILSALQRNIQAARRRQR